MIVFRYQLAMFARLPQRPGIRGQWGRSLIRMVDACSRNMWLERRNLLAMSADCDIPDGHHLRENTRDPSFYGGVEQFTAAPCQRHGLQFQRHRHECAKHTQYSGSGRRHHHIAIRAVYVVNASDHLKGDQTEGRGFRSHYR
jgi:hypothetical protein